MSQDYGIAMPSQHPEVAHRAPVRYLLLLEGGGGMVARMFLENHAQVQECDAAATEVANMTAGIAPTLGALGPEWDQALRGHSLQERASASVFTLAT